MDDRVIEVLRGALDEAQKIAERTVISFSDAGEWTSNYGPDGWTVWCGGGEVATGMTECDARHAARWDPSTVLRLVARDRELLRWYEAAGKPAGLHPAIDLAARFWIGEETPDGRVDQ